MANINIAEGMSINSCRQENNKKVMRTTVIRGVSIKWGWEGQTEGRYAEVHSEQKTGCVEKVQENVTDGPYPV